MNTGRLRAALVTVIVTTLAAPAMAEVGGGSALDGDRRITAEHPIIAAFRQVLEDTLEDAELLPIRRVDTAHTARASAIRLGYAAADVAIRTALPALLADAGARHDADQVRRLAPITDARTAKAALALITRADKRNSDNLEKLDDCDELDRCMDENPLFALETAYDAARQIAESAVALGTSPDLAEDIASDAAQLVLETMISAVEAHHALAQKHARASTRRLSIDFIDKLGSPTNKDAAEHVVALRDDLISMSIVTEAELARLENKHSKLGVGAVGYATADHGIRVVAADSVSRLGHPDYAKKLRELPRIDDTASADSAGKLLERMRADVVSKQCDEDRYERFYELEGRVVDLIQLAELAESLASDPDIAEEIRFNLAGLLEQSMWSESLDPATANRVHRQAGQMAANSLRQLVDIARNRSKRARRSKP